MIDDPTGNTIQHRISYRPPTWWERLRWETVFDIVCGMIVLAFAIGFLQGAVQAWFQI